MPTYELILETSPLDEAQEEFILSNWDSTIGGHGSTTLVTLTAEGVNAPESFAHARNALNTRGIGVVRLYEDLVDRGAIALRSNVSKQNVSQWVLGQRHGHSPFPEPYNLVGGGIWLWGEVAAWLKKVGLVQDNLHYPSRLDYARCNAALDAQLPQAV